jgi:ubiquinone/menaquinone biosynthesis C-methylase UbiE
LSRPRQIRFLSSVARLYEPVVAVLGFRRLWHRVAELAAPSSGARALDVCTGTGGVASALAARGARVVGVDLAHGMLRVAHRRNHVSAAGEAIRLARGDACALPFPDDAFRRVTCCMSLHEMSEAERGAVLLEIRRIAACRVAVAEYRVPRSRLGRLLFRLRHAFEYLESDAFEPFVARAFESRLAEAGLEVRQIDDVGPFRIWLCEAGSVLSREQTAHLPQPREAEETS